jgi:hypothetical protein
VAICDWTFGLHDAVCLWYDGKLFGNDRLLT